MLTALSWWGPNGVREWDRRMMKDRTREIERREGRKGRLGRATEGWETGMGGPQFTPTNNGEICAQMWYTSHCLDTYMYTQISNKRLREWGQEFRLVVSHQRITNH